MARSSRVAHPCTVCGACCSYFRVQFYWREAEPDHPSPVPIRLTEDLDQHRRVMIGTNVPQDTVRCIALRGKIGKQSLCAIYSQRPTPCRAFKASLEDGTPNRRCDEARINRGLKPLTEADWIEVNAAHLAQRI